jgi:O-antigen/teichoic acid export membrane protein
LTSNEDPKATAAGAVSARESSSRGLFANIFKSSGVYSITMILQRSVGFALLPFTTHRLTTGDYGLAGVLEQVSSVLAILLSLQFAWAVGYFHFQCKSDEERRKVAGTCVIGTGALGVFICLVCWPLAPFISRLVFGSEMATGYIRLSLATMPPAFLLEALFNWSRVVDNQRLYTLGNAVRTVATVVGVIAFVWFLRLRVWGVQSAAAFSAVIAVAYFGPPFFRLARPLFSMKVFWKMARFSTSIGLSSMAVFFIHFGDRFFLVHYRALSDVGIYDVSYKLGMMVSGAYSAFNSYWSAQVYQIMKRPDSHSVVGRLFTYVMLGTAFCGLCIALGARPVLRIMAAPSYQGAAVIAPLLVAAYCVRVVGDFWRCIFLAAGLPAYDAGCNWVGALVCLAGYIFLIPRYGIWGAAITTFVAFFVIALVSVPWAYSVRPCHIETLRLLKICIAAAVSIGVFALLNATPLLLQILCLALALAAFPLTLWALRFPTPGEIESASAATVKAARAIGQFSAEARGRLFRG